MKKPAVWIAVFVAAFVAIVVYSTMSAGKHRVEVCLEYNGRSACRTASAATAESALRTAQDNACAFLASGMTDSIACGRAAPSKVTWLSGK